MSLAKDVLLKMPSLAFEDIEAAGTRSVKHFDRLGDGRALCEVTLHEP